MAVGDRVDPYAQFNFTIELDGQDRGGFTEVGGLTAESDIIEYREGRDNPATIVNPDVEASNGVVHVIDGVLLPPPARGG